MNLIHGDARGGRSTEYITWQGMKQRCQDERRKDYGRYGGRGISVCERWQKFENFLADMGRKPSPKHTLDRIDNNGDYGPGNCRWATRSEQRTNRRLQNNKKTGFPHVRVESRTGRFVGVLKIGGRVRYCGTYATPQEASAAAMRAKGEL